MKTRITLFFLCIASLLSAKTFTTEGNGLRQILDAKAKDQTIIYTSEIDGALGAYTLDGKKLWQQPTQKAAVMFEIIAYDIDGDKDDELLAASADGHIYCYDATGKMLWKYAPEAKVRFSEVAVVNNGKVQIFAGGNDYKLYELNAEGELVGTTKISGVFRKLESGRFLDKKEESLLVFTYAHDKFRWDMMAIIDADSKEILSSFDYKKANPKLWSPYMVTDMDIADINKDGLDDILYFGSGKVPAIFVGLTGEFEQIALFKGSNKLKQRYSHTQGACLLPQRDEVVFQFGGVTIVTDLKGKVKEQVGEKHRGLIYNGLIYLPDEEQLLAAGQVGGGNTIYSFDTKKKNWLYTEHEMQGRLTKVEDNLNTLYEQTLKFKAPSYQKPSDKPWIMMGQEIQDNRTKKLDFNPMITITQQTWYEDFDRKDIVKVIGKDALKRDRRGKYTMTQDDILAKARAFEKRGEPFTVWAGHVTDPFYISIETLEKILEVAPKTCYGFIYAEMSSVTDPRSHYYIDYMIPRLAKALRKNGKAKLYFRYKNVFWAANSHLDPWKELFFSGKYNDIIVPASEDTSNRTQDINLSGRVGMFCAGYCDDFAMRLVDDNPTSWRPLTPGGQRSASPFIRQGVLLAAYGARVGINFPSRYIESPGYDILYALMRSGVLPVVEKEDILSISSWHLTKDIDMHWLDDFEDHHKLHPAKAEDLNAIISVPHMQWAGVDIPEWDYSKAALGVEYRWLNFVPEMPNGMVPIAPSEVAPELEKQEMPYTVSNYKHGWNGDKAISAKEFGKTILATAEKGAAKMPIAVKGASWAAIRIDESHIRVILMDQGYIDPQEREATIIFQKEGVKGAVNILTKEGLKISGNKANVTVPAGSLVFIDVAY